MSLLAKLLPPERVCFSEFYITVGVCPSLERGEKPWRYRGWLLFYIQEHHGKNPNVPDRWGYLYDLIRGIDRGPIPKIQFLSNDSQCMANIKECINIAGNYGARGWGWEAFRLYLEFLAYGLSLKKPQGEMEPNPGELYPIPDLSDEVMEKLYRTVNLVPFLESPYDYLGTYISEQKAGGWNPTAFFPTPHAVVECMVQMLFFDVKEKAKQTGRDSRYMTTCDPCVGTGRMLLHASNYTLTLTGVDIDPMVLLVLQINAALYAPWIIVPPPSEVPAHMKGIRIIKKPIENRTES